MSSFREKSERYKQHSACLESISKISSTWLKTRKEAKAAKEYIDKRVPEKFHDLFGFGFFPSSIDSVYEFMHDLKQETGSDPEQMLLDAGVLYSGYRKHAIFFENNQLLIPFRNAYGKMVSISGRTLLPDSEAKEKNVVKYKHLSFKKGRHLFGLHLSRNAIVKKNEAIVVEGQFDVASSIIYGLDNVVGMCGNTLCMDQLLLLKRYTDRIVMMPDNDAAGEEGFTSAAKKAKQLKMQIMRKSFPQQYHDMDEYIKKLIEMRAP